MVSSSLKAAASKKYEEDVTSSYITVENMRVRGGPKRFGLSCSSTDSFSRTLPRYKDQNSLSIVPTTGCRSEKSCSARIYRNREGELSSTREKLNSSSALLNFPGTPN